MVIRGCYHKWFGLVSGGYDAFCMMDNACSQLLLRSCISVLEQDREALKLKTDNFLFIYFLQVVLSRILKQ